jgi:hypothetical protein
MIFNHPFSYASVGQISQDTTKDYILSQKSKLKG